MITYIRLPGAVRVLVGLRFGIDLVCTGLVAVEAMPAPIGKNGLPPGVVGAGDFDANVPRSLARY